MVGQMGTNCYLAWDEESKRGFLVDPGEQADKIITKDSKGYGVRNVNERIKLYYGEQYELKIESEIGKGTKVIVHFPKML